MNVKSELLNGGPGSVIADPAQEQVIQMLEGALRMARAGQISGVGIAVACGNGKPDIALAGRHALEVYYAAGRLQRVIEKQLDGAASSAIVRING